VVDGYALVKRTPIPEGDVLTFAPHRPSVLDGIRTQLAAGGWHG
jgi:hypothetical protein